MYGCVLFEIILLYKQYINLYISVALSNHQAGNINLQYIIIFKYKIITVSFFTTHTLIKYEYLTIVFALLKSLSWSVLGPI